MDTIILSQAFFWLLGIFGVLVLLVSAWYVTLFEPEDSMRNAVVTAVGAFVCPLVWIALVVVGAIWLSIASSLAVWISVIIALVAILAYPYVLFALGFIFSILYGVLVTIYYAIKNCFVQE